MKSIKNLLNNTHFDILPYSKLKKKNTFLAKNSIIKICLYNFDSFSTCNQRLKDFKECNYCFVMKTRSRIGHPRNNDKTTNVTTKRPLNCHVK